MATTEQLVAMAANIKHASLFVDGTGSSINTNQYWINGKPIFRVVLDISDDVQNHSGDSTSLDSRFSTTDMSGIWDDATSAETIVDYRVMIQQADSNVFTNAAYLNQTAILDADFGFSSIFTGTGIMTITGSAGPSLVGATVYVIIEYTKV